MTPEVQTSTREITLATLLREGNCRASKLANSIGISVQAMRRHLRSLEEDGLVEAKPMAIGPGRPSNLWQLTNKGHNGFNNEKGSERFAIELFRSIEKSYSSEMINTLLGEQAKAKATLYRREIGFGKVNDRLEKLVELRNQEGYMAEIHQFQDGSSSWYLNAFHCSIRNIAEQYPVVCDQELELIRFVFPDCQVERVQWRLESGHSCGFQITPLKRDA